MGAWVHGCMGAWVHGCSNNTFQQLMKQWDRMKVCIYMHMHVCKYLLTLSIINSDMAILLSNWYTLQCEGSTNIIIANIGIISE